MPLTSAAIRTPPKPARRERKEKYLAHFASASPKTRMILAADNLDNIRSLLAAYDQSGEAVWQHFRGGRDGTLWYFRLVRDIRLDMKVVVIDLLEPIPDKRNLPKTRTRSIDTGVEMKSGQTCVMSGLTHQVGKPGDESAETLETLYLITPKVLD